MIRLCYENIESKMELKDMKMNFKLISGSYIRDSPRTWIGNPVNPHHNHQNKV